MKFHIKMASHVQTYEQFEWALGGVNTFLMWSFKKLIECLTVRTILKKKNSIRFSTNVIVYFKQLHKILNYRLINQEIWRDSWLEPFNCSFQYTMGDHCWTSTCVHRQRQNAVCMSRQQWVTCQTRLSLQGLWAAAFIRFPCTLIDYAFLSQVLLTVQKNTVFCWERREEIPGLSEKSWIIFNVH